VFWKTTGNAGIPDNTKSEESKNENARFYNEKRAFFLYEPRKFTPLEPSGI
jgi:hypothetical protein